MNLFNASCFFSSFAFNRNPLRVICRVAKSAVLLVCCAAFATNISIALAAQATDSLSPEIRARFNAAVEAHQAGRFAAASQNYAAVLRDAPDFAPAVLNLGLVEFAEHHPENARPLLERARALLPNSQPAWLFSGLSAYQMNDFAAAVEPLKHAVGLQPNDPHALLFLGQAYNALRQYRDAALVLEQAQKQDPKNTEVLYALSQTYMHLALETSELLRATDPHSARVYQLAGQMFVENQNYSAAISEFKELVRRYPEFPGGHGLLGVAYEDTGKDAEALDAYKLEIGVDAFNSEMYARAGRLMMQAGDEANGATFLKHALQLDPGSEVAVVAYGKYLVKQRQTTEALEVLRKAVGLISDNKNVHFLLAQAYLQAGKPQDAERERSIFEDLNKQQAAQKERGPSSFADGSGEQVQH